MDVAEAAGLAIARASRCTGWPALIHNSSRQQTSPGSGARTLPKANTPAGRRTKNTMILPTTPSATGDSPIINEPAQPRSPESSATEGTPSMTTNRCEAIATLLPQALSDTNNPTEAEQRRYSKLVKRWNELQGAWYECIDILITIRDQRLYRAEYDNFEDFCQKKLGMTRANAYRRLQSAEVAKEVETNVYKPTHEGHVRPLLVLQNRDDRIAAFRAAAGEAESTGKPLTGRLVAKAVAEITKGRRIKGTSPKPAPSPNRTPTSAGTNASKSAGEQHIKSAPSGEHDELANDTSEPLACEGFLTGDQLKCALGKLVLVAKNLDDGKLSQARVSELERGFLTIMAAVYKIAGADADQADKRAVVAILRSVANTVETAT